MTRPPHRWASGPSFAEVAEALGVETDRIVGFMKTNERYVVLYTPHDYERVHKVVLSRRLDGILRADTEPERIAHVEEFTRRIAEEGQ